MTREERADYAAKLLADTSHSADCALNVCEWDQALYTANELREMECDCDREVRAMLAYGQERADAEAAAMRERTLAEVAESLREFRAEVDDLNASFVKRTGIPSQAGTGAISVIDQMISAIAAIRALPTTEVRNG